MIQQKLFTSSREDEMRRALEAGRAVVANLKHDADLIAWASCNDLNSSRNHLGQ
jgi:hypothetical protein